MTSIQSADQKIKGSSANVLRYFNISVLIAAVGGVAIGGVAVGLPVPVA